MGLAMQNLKGIYRDLLNSHDDISHIFQATETAKSAALPAENELQVEFVASLNGTEAGFKAGSRTGHAFGAFQAQPKERI